MAVPVSARLLPGRLKQKSRVVCHANILRVPRPATRFLQLAHDGIICSRACWAASQGISSATSETGSPGPSKADSGVDPTASAPSWMASHGSTARKLLSMSDAAEATEMLRQEAAAEITAEDCCELMNAALDEGNVRLAVSMHAAMRAARRRMQSVSSSSKSRSGRSFSWPVSTIQSTCSLLLGLCRQIAINEALETISEIRVQGVPRHEDVGFGRVISSPLAPGRTLAVVQPQEGLKLVADAYSKYEYEIFTGKVLTCSSEAIPSQAANPLFILARAVGLQRSAAAAAVHTLTVQAPDGTSRTFRCATESSNVPAQSSERVTIVASPFKNSRKGSRAIFSATPPGRLPGEAMQATNHRTGIVTELMRPPSSEAQASTVPGWVLPALVILAGGDAASSILDPALPAMIAAGSVAAIGTVLTGTTVLVPRLKQLSDRDVSMEYIRQQLLGQYAMLAGKCDEVTRESNEDVRVLARLWQLQTKMESVGQTATAYSARISRVSLARQNIEGRLGKKLELLDGYARVMNMIEIEVEMDIEVPEAELVGIEEQMARLEDLEGFQDDWRVQAEARDEVERLLKSI